MHQRETQLRSKARRKPTGHHSNCHNLIASRRFRSSVYANAFGLGRRAVHGVGILRVPAGTLHMPHYGGASRKMLWPFTVRSWRCRTLAQTPSRSDRHRQSTASQDVHLQPAPPILPVRTIGCDCTWHEQQWHLKIRDWRGSRAMEAPSTHCVLDGSLNDTTPSQREHSTRDTVLEACNVVSTL